MNWWTQQAQSGFCCSDQEEPLRRYTVADGIQGVEAYPWSLFLDDHCLVADNIIWGSPLSTWITSRTKRPNLIILPRRICYSKPAFCNPLLQVMQYLTGVSISLQLEILIFQNCNQRIKFAPQSAIPGPCCNWKWHQSFGQMVEYLTPNSSANLTI